LPNGRAGHAEEISFCFPSAQVDDVAVRAEERPFDCMFETYVNLVFNMTLHPSTTPPTVPPETVPPGTVPPGTGTPATPATPVVEQPSFTG